MPGLEDVSPPGVDGIASQWNYFSNLSCSKFFC